MLLSVDDSYEITSVNEPQYLVHNRYKVGVLNTIVKRRSRKHARRCEPAYDCMYITPGGRYGFNFTMCQLSSPRLLKSWVKVLRNPGNFRSIPLYNFRELLPWFKDVIPDDVFAELALLYAEG